MPIIQEFERSLRTHSKPSHARWWTVDLHNHSPASPDYRGDRTAALDHAVRHLSSARVDVVMFTDHHALPDRDFVDVLRKRTGKTVLRGTELNIFVDAWAKPKAKIEKQAFFHLLVGFSPETDADYWLTHITKKYGGEERTVSGTTIHGLSSRVNEICSTLKEAGAIMVPAHLHTNRDAFKSRSVDDIYTDDEFLKLARDHFTALEVTDPKTAAFFDGTREETHKLHISCIQSSDAHDVTSIGQRLAYVQMESPTFAELKAGLEIPLRVSLEKPVDPASHIVGINIRGQFFQDLWLSLSPNCNALIGVKGSGKTSVLECLRFALGALVPISRKEEVQSHLSHILGQSGSVQVLVKRDDGAKILIERTASRPDVFAMIFEDDRREDVQNPDALMFTSFILGWHEIEQAATDPSVREAYLDTIADRETIRQLQETADEKIGRIRSLHEQVTNLYANYKALRDRVSRLKDLRSGLKELTDAELIQLKDTYEIANQQKHGIEKLASWLEEHSRTEDHWRVPDVAPDLPLLDGESPIREFASEAAAILNDLRAHGDVFAGAHRQKVVEHAASLADNKARLRTAFEQFAAEYDGAVSALSDERRRLLESHRQVLDQTM